jgi:hypothetical protein
LFEYSLPELNQGYIYTDKSCVCNELIALKQRHQVDDGNRFKSEANLKKVLRPFIAHCPPTSEEHIISRCAGTKRALMLQAQESLETKPLNTSDGAVKMFLKDDKYQRTAVVRSFLGMEPEEDEYSNPRCIQYRSKRYCLRLATYLHPIEQHVYTLKDSSDTPIFAKSRNQTQRAQDLFLKWEHFSSPKALLLDHSKFDAHVGVELLMLEHWFYNHCFESDELRFLLDLQLDNKGYTKNGTFYRTIATRMSGDQNTGLGNSIINYAILKSFSDFFNLEACFYVDGDDSVLIVEDTKLTPTMEYFKQFGMTTKLDTTTQFEHVEFCQTRPVFDGASWRMVRNPYRTLMRTPWTVKSFSVKQQPIYLASIGDCEVALGLGLPIGQYVGDKLRSFSEKRMVTDLHYVANKEYVRPRRAQVIQPTYECRLSYQEAWGISPDEQIEIETCTLSRKVSLEVDFEEFPFQ